MMFLDTLRIETPRLLLRVPRLEDLDAMTTMTTMMSDAETARFIGGVMPRPVMWRVLMALIGSWHAHGFSMFSVIEKSTGLWIGRLGPWRPDGWPGTEIGWAISRDSWGRGYATEGATAATDWAIDTLGWSDIIHSIAPGNIASQRVALKLGSRNRGPGVLPPPLQSSSVDIWGQTSDEWRGRSSPVGRSALGPRVPNQTSVDT